jgi:hypothetical protein
VIDRLPFPLAGRVLTEQSNADLQLRNVGAARTGLGKLRHRREHDGHQNGKG